MQQLQVATHRTGATWISVESRFEIACFGIACFIGVAGAFVGLQAHGFWFDEFITAWIIEPGGGVGNLISRIVTDVHPPLYYAVLFVYSKVAGHSDAALRSFSALSMGAALLIFVAATRRTFSLPARLFGGAIASGSLFWFVQSQNARPYALCLLIGAGILALCLSFLAERQKDDTRMPRTLVGLIALMFVGSFVHFYVMYECVAALIVLALFNRRQRYAMVGIAAALLISSALYVKFVVTPFSQANLGSNWYRNDPEWYYRVLESSAQYSFGAAGSLALAICAGVFLFYRRSARPLTPRSSVGSFPLDPVTALLVGVPVLVLMAGIVGSTLFAPNFFDRNFLVVCPFLWGLCARVYDAAMAGAPRPIRLAINLALSAVVLSMAAIVMERLPSKRPPLLYEPFRESAEWIKTVPECRDQIVPVTTADRSAWYKPGFAEVLYASAYGRYLHGFALAQLVFAEEIVAHRLPADLRAELQRRLDGDGCPILAWSVHNMNIEAMAVIKDELLRSMDRPVAKTAVKTKVFRDGQVGFVLFLDR